MASHLLSEGAAPNYGAGMQNQIPDQDNNMYYSPPEYGGEAGEAYGGQLGGGYEWHIPAAGGEVQAYDGGQDYGGPAQGYAGPAQGYAGPAHGYAGPAHGYAGPAQYAGPAHEDVGYEDLQIGDPGGEVQMNYGGEQMVVVAPRKLGRPWFVIFVIAVCILVFIAEIGENGWTFAPIQANPQIGPSSRTLSNMGAKDAQKIARHGEYWRLFTAMWLHAGIFHILFNLSAIWQIGGPLEQKFGPTRIAILYVIAGLYGNLCSSVFIPEGLSVGASGSIFGLIGSLWADVIQNCNQETPGQGQYSIPALAMATILCLAFGLLPFVDNFAHLGGFVSGLLGGLAFLVYWKYGSQSGRTKARQLIIGATALLVLAILGIIFFTLLGTSNANNWCSNCKYLDCFPTPYWSCDIDSNIICTPSNGPNGTIAVLCTGGPHDGNTYYVNAPAVIDTATCKSLCA